MKAVADYKELHDLISKEKTVVVNVAVNAADIDKPVSHSGHPMHATPRWIKLFNDWKDKQ